MNAQSTARAGGCPARRSTAARDPLQIPIAMEFAPDLGLARIADALRSVALWASVFAVAASGALLLANMAPS